jgi:hypothetical protein
MLMCMNGRNDIIRFCQRQTFSFSRTGILNGMGDQPIFS